MAGASAADVRSILSLPHPSTPGPSQPRKAPNTTERARKPEGISRELYSLIGPSVPSLTAQLAKPRLKQKPNLGGGGRVKWEWKPFKNSARNDSLTLSHWAKVGGDPDAEYPFAKYNVQPMSFVYSQDEYSRFLEAKTRTGRRKKPTIFSSLSESTTLGGTLSMTDMSTQMVRRGVSKT